MRTEICGVGIDNFSLIEVIQKITDHVLSGGAPSYIVTPNAAHIVELQKDKLFRKVYHEAFLSVPDGVSLLWAARILGQHLKMRVNGTDLLEKLCENSIKNRFRFFFLGGRPGAAKKAQKILQLRNKNLNIVGTYCPPYGFENVSSELIKINYRIKEAAPEILFVGLGAPKQELWIYRNYIKLNIPVSIGIGVSFELISGMVPRAPVFMQKNGLEWLFRLLVEPKRLWKRYILGNAKFIKLVFKHRRRQLGHI